MEHCGNCNMATELRGREMVIKPETEGNEDGDLGKAINRKDQEKLRSGKGKYGKERKLGRKEGSKMLD